MLKKVINVHKRSGQNVIKYMTLK